MPQNTNIQGVWYFLSRLGTPPRPTCYVPDLRYINFPAIQRSSIRYLLFDKDNCLTLPYQQELYPSLSHVWEECRQLFPGNQCLVVSNSAGTRDDFESLQAKSIEKALAIQVLRHVLKKPLCGPEILAYLKKCFPGRTIKPSEILVIGDRLWTDVGLADREGFASILTEPLESERDPWTVQFIRNLETCHLKIKTREIHPFIRSEPFH